MNINWINEYRRNGNLAASIIDFDVHNRTMCIPIFKGMLV